MSIIIRNNFIFKETHVRTEFYSYIIIAKPRDLSSPNSPKQFQLYFDQILANDAERTNTRLYYKSLTKTQLIETL